MTIQTTSKLISGIYQILHVESGKRYIGQSSNVRRRLLRHKSRLAINKHVNKSLQNAWNKYSSDAFSFEPIIYCSLGDLNEYEEFYIDKYSSNKKEYGYNFRVVTSSNRGMILESRTYKAGEKYNYLTLLERLGNKNDVIRWKCLCDCGKNVEVSVAAVISGNTKSCGCIQGRYVVLHGEKMRMSVAERALGARQGGLSKLARKHQIPLDLAIEYYILRKKIEDYKKEHNGPLNEKFGGICLSKPPENLSFMRNIKSIQNCKFMIGQAIQGIAA